MFAKSVSRGSVGKFHKTLMVALALVVLFASLPAGKAYAWGMVNRYRAPVVNQGPLNVTMGSNYGIPVLWVNGQGPIFDSNNIAWGNHTVTAQYQLEQWLPNANGTYGWKYITGIEHRSYVTLGTGPYVSLDDVGFYIPLSARGTYRVTFKIWWHNSAGIIAYTEVVPNTGYDFVCHYLYNLPCVSGFGWFRF